MSRATVSDAGARRTYLRIVSGEDRQAIGRLQAAREDMLLRQRSLVVARKAAARVADAKAADLAELQKAADGQRALLSQTNGELVQLVAAKQARRGAEDARLY